MHSSKFRMGRESIEDEPRFRHPATATTEEIYRFHYTFMDDRRLTLNLIAKAISISRERVENNPQIEPGLTKIFVCWLPRRLKPDQKRTRLVTSWENLILCEANPVCFLERFKIKEK